jgi:hypothetical protein
MYIEWWEVDMGDRFYQQIGKAHNLKSVKEIMDFCEKPQVKRETKRTKRDIAVNLGIPGLAKLSKENLLWVEMHIDDLSLEAESYSKKKDLVTDALTKYSEVDWNAITFDTLKQVFGYA